jgi:hypothetical protein
MKRAQREEEDAELLSMRTVFVGAHDCGACDVRFERGRGRVRWTSDGETFMLNLHGVTLFGIDKRHCLLLLAEDGVSLEWSGDDGEGDAFPGGYDPFLGPTDCRSSVLMVFAGAADSFASSTATLLHGHPRLRQKASFKDYQGACRARGLSLLGSKVGSKHAASPICLPRQSTDARATRRDYSQLASGDGVMEEEEEEDEEAERWVQCGRCQKWRRVPTAARLPEDCTPP